MGVLTRMLVPRSVRRAVHPARTVRRAVTPKTVKKMGRAAHPLSNVVYGVERSLNTKPRSRNSPHEMCCRGLGGEGGDPQFPA